MSNPQNDPNLGDNLKRLLAGGVPLLATGGNGLQLPAHLKRPHVFQGIPGPAQAALSTLAQTTKFPMREIAELYRTVGGNLDDTINIVTRAQAQGASLADLIAATVAQSAAAGQDVHPDEITVDCYVSEANRVHIEFNKSIRYLMLTREGVESLIDALGQSLAGLSE
jgi:hypothetical protein